jgi:filamentous hemagglutinin
LLGQNPQAAVTAAANEYMNNCAAGDDACKRLAQQGALSPFSGSAIAAACGDGSQPCNTQLLQTMVQAQAANAAVAGQNLQTMALYGVPLVGVALLGPEALTAAGLAGVYDYAGDAYSYATGLSKDTPNFTKSYITGIIGGLTYPFAIGDEAIASTGLGGKIAANGYNALVAGTGAFGAAAVTHQDNPDLSGGLATGLAATGSWAKSATPGPLGNFANQLIQGIAGPLQSYIQKQQSKSGN